MFLNGITSGGNYRFTYAARNIQGTGPQSDPTLVIAATVPAKMNTPVVTYQPGLLYRVTFTMPSSGGTGVPIDAYEILFLHKDGLTFTAIAECDGTVQAVKDNLYCEANLASLVASPFLLVQGDQIIAKVRASNSVGWGAYSSYSYNGALVVAVPKAPLAAPVRYSPGSTQTSTRVDMPTISGFNAGGLPILSY